MSKSGRLFYTACFSGCDNLMLKVALNGYGTIGMRVADAILKQDDMELAGVTKTHPDFKFFEAVDRGIDVYAVSSEKPFEDRGASVKGNLRELLSKANAVIDCSPKHSGAENMEIYRLFPELRAIFQGGEKHNLTNFSFNSHCNYNEATGRKYARVVSCNTTALCRVISQIDKAYKIKKARVAVVRRSIDPGAGSKKGPINAWEPSMEYPSHHAKDVSTVLPGIKVSSLAGIAPMTIMHGHMLFAEFHNAPETSDDVLRVLAENQRIKIVSSEDGFLSTAQLKDNAESNGRNGNIYEVCVWKESVGLDEDGELGMHIAIDQQADVVPENIDAIRAMFGMMSAEKSIEKTNAALGIGAKRRVLDREDAVFSRIVSFK